MNRGTALAVAVALATVLQATALGQLCWQAFGPHVGTEAAALRLWATTVLPSSPCDGSPDQRWPLPGSAELRRVHTVALQCTQGVRLVAARAPLAHEVDSPLARPLSMQQRLAFGASELHYVSQAEGNVSLLFFVAMIGLGVAVGGLALVLLRRERQAIELLSTSANALCGADATPPAPGSAPAAHALVETCQRSLGRIEALFAREATRHALIRLRVRRLCDQLALGLIIYDADGRIRGINRHARKLLGIAQLGRHPSHMGALLADDESHTLKRLLDQLQRTGSHAMAEREFRRQLRTVHGETLIVQATEHLVGRRHAPRVLLAFQDRTAAEQTESALQQAIQEARTASEMKSRFLAMISHEIRTPLNGITGLTDLLKRESPAPHQAENIDLLQESTHHLRNLLTDILDFSKIESGQMQLESQDFNLRTLVESTCNAMQGAARTKSLQLDTDLHLAIEWVRGDPTRVRQVITNLIDNAIKFTAEGGITVSCRTATSSGGNGLVDVSFSIADTGIGMTADTVRKLFKPFTQASLSITRKFGGTGLGLSLCRLLCRRMDGDIMVTSTPGLGSTFSFHVRLVAIAPPPSPRACTDAPGGHADTALQGKTILVADDNALNRRILKRWLDLRGAIVQLAEDGQEALQAATSGDLDAVLMDISMPNMDGIEATQRIRDFEFRNDRKPVAIIGVTALSTSDDFAAGSSAGMNACISKPVDRDTLMRVMDRLIGSTRTNGRQDLP